ncbi:hypothetical protein [Paucibacter sp. Y2R2-4]|uniref:hypothetical protein n=1 Tax=Paucibacter sp. Y2R2-4 TaxID=2893553 RepID=UPI0021E46277|nr:hypothetical protein [Paucibacter sp. Y2R2-4]MCV2352431.1 hypothetical protein [Paucibacter sp. Y2R2-4]
MLPLSNAGVRPAMQLEGRIYMTPVDATAAPLLDHRFSVANPIPANSPTPWYNDSLVLPREAPPHFVLLGIEYVDPIADKRFRQAFFMRWDGVQNGETQPDFVHVTSHEKAVIESRFSAVIGPYTTDA